LELARSGVWLLWAEGECVGDNDRVDADEVEQAQEWATNAIKSRCGVWVESWSGESPVYVATVNDPVGDDRDDRRRTYLIAVSEDGDPYTRELERRLGT
jgi:hypothetical protein